MNPNLATYLILFLASACQADDAALRATIRLPRNLPPKAILDFGGLEISWSEPLQVERGFVWFHCDGLPWIKLHAKASEEENLIISRLLKQL